MVQNGPFGVFLEFGDRPGVIIGVVGAEMEEGARGGVVGQPGEVLGVDEAVLVVTTLGPGVGVKDENLGQALGWGEGVEDLGGFSL